MVGDGHVLLICGINAKDNQKEKNFEKKKFLT
jgi:hypothetical protein